jgi:hypothetical protein
MAPRPAATEPTAALMNRLECTLAYPCQLRAHTIASFAMVRAACVPLYAAADVIQRRISSADVALGMPQPGVMPLALMTAPAAGERR